MGDDRPARYLDNGLVVYRASALGSCPKVLVAIGLSMTPEPYPRWLLDRFAEGVAGEPEVLSTLEAFGWHLYWEQNEVELPVGSGVIIRGHIDAAGERHGDHRLVEVKCVSPAYREVIARDLPPLFHWQMAVYGRATRLPVMLALGVKDDDGLVVRVETSEPVVAGPVAIKLRVMELERHIAEGTWPKCTYRQWPCPFPELCDDPVPEGTEEWELEQRLRESLVHVRR